MKATIFMAIYFFSLLVACKGKKEEARESRDEATATTATTATESNSGNLTEYETIANQFFAPIKLSQMYPSSHYNINDEAVDAVNTCGNFGVIDRTKLNSGGDLYWETVSRNDKNKIKLFKLASGDFDKNTKAFVFDYTNSLDTFCANEGKVIKVRLVAGIRIVYTVKEWNLKVGMDGLEKIAASKELNFSNSSLHVSTIGWGQDSTSILALKSAIQKINVKNYPEACQALLELMSAYGGTSQVRPEVIPIE